MKALVLGTILVLAATLAPLPAQARTPEGAYQRQVFVATNHQREQHHRADFRRQACVQKYAVRQARRMARQDRMFHQDLARVLRDCRLSVAGENVAAGYRTGRSAVDDGWMQSEGHRDNILNRRFRLLGAGARQSADGTWYAAQVFGGR
jgi:uncharacterized protein YkwD